tara:strand:+ start:4315 stop:4767 length:453 start_codon:yes stop_codon:yes gene_type:complete
MAIALNIYDSAQRFLLTGGTDFSLGTIRCSLHTSSGSFSAAHDTWSDVSGNEISESKYLPVDLSLDPTEGITLSVDPVSRILSMDAPDIDFGTDLTWTTARYMIIRDYVNDRLLLHVDLDGTQSPVSGSWKYIIDATYGLLRLGVNNGYS